jgi:hypothetical protein
MFDACDMFFGGYDTPSRGNTTKQRENSLDGGEVASTSPLGDPMYAA